MSGAAPVALITGGGRGLGRTIALRLAADGFAVAIASRSIDQLRAVAAEIEVAGGTAAAIACDVTNKADVDRAVDGAAALGSIAVLVNNAGVPGPIGPIGVVDPLDWWHAQTVHVLGAMLFMGAVVPHMTEAGGGRIISVGSQAGTFVAPAYSSYCVAKASLIRLTEFVAAEGRARGVRAFPIQPGTIITDMSRETIDSPAAQKWAAPLISLLETVSPEDSAQAEIRLGDFVSDIARGRWDGLSGRYLDIDWDLAAMLREAEAASE